MPDATASCKLIDPIIQVARHNHLDIPTLLSAAGLKHGTLDQAGARIPTSTLVVLLEQLARRTGNTRIALRIGDATQPRILGSVGFLMTTADTLAQAYQSLADYLPLLIEGIQLRIERGPRDTVLELQTSAGRMLVEWLMACLYNWSRNLTGMQIPVARVDFAFPAAAAVQPYQQFFAAEISFASDRNRLVLPTQYLDRPCLDTNPELYRLHQTLADDLLSTTGQGGALVARVRTLIRQRLKTGRADFSRHDVAAALNLSLRTLQRKLDRQNTHFQLLYDQTRRELAIELIQRGNRSLGEISYQLGFSGLSAFQKAFQRWTGSSPGTFRQQQARSGTSTPPQRLAERIGACGLTEARFYPLALQIVDLVNSTPTLRPESPELSPYGLSVIASHRGPWQLKWLDTVRPLSLDVLQYRAPETFGLLPDIPDRRATVYSLGCLLYFMLHGHPPHPGHQLRPLIRSRLNQAPDIRRDLSTPLRQLLAKLLALPVAERYPALEPLREDLERCQQQLTAPQHTPDSSSAGTVQHLPLLSLPSLLLRDRDKARLEQQLQQTRDGQGRLLLILGPCGSGKSALLNALRTELAPSGARVLATRFQAQPGAGHPNALTELLRQLVFQECAASDAQFSHWRHRLLDLPQENLQQLTALLPETATLLTQPAAADPPPPELHPGALFGKLLRLSLSDQLVIICLDDLHHADSAAVATLNLLTGLLENARLLIVCTYNADDTPASNPFSHQLPLLRELARSTELTLESLSLEDIRSLLARLLECSDAERAQLAERLYRKSRGKLPELEKQLQQLQSLYGLEFDPLSRRWKWQPDAMPSTPPDSVPPSTQLVAGFARLPKRTRDLLTMAAVAGSHFDAKLLAIACNQSWEGVTTRLAPAIAGALICPLTAEAAGPHYRFATPSLGRYLCGNLAVAHRAASHRSLGRALLPPHRDDAGDEDFFRALKHLNRAQCLVPDPAATLELARLNLEAGRRARDTGALTPAREHLQRGCTWLEAVPATQAMSLAFELGLSHAELESQGGHYPAAQAIFTRLKHHATDSQALTRLSLALSSHCHRQGQTREALQALLGRLTDCGIRLPADPQAQLGQALVLAQQLIAPDSASATLPQPALPDTDADRVTDSVTDSDALLQQLCQLADQLADSNLALCALAQMAQLTGQGAGSAHAWAGRAFISSWLCGDNHQGQHAAQQARVLATAQEPASRARTLLLLGARIEPWTTPLEHSIETLQTAHSLACEAGDWNTAAQATMIGGNSRWMRGEPLDVLASALGDQQQRLGQLHNPVLEQRLQGSVIRLLRGLGALPGGQGALAAPLAVPDPAMEPDPWCLVTDCATAYLLNRRDDWPRLLLQAPAAETALSGFCALSELVFFTALMRVELCRHVTSRRRTELLRLLLHDETRMTLWSEQNPATFGHRRALLEAEKAALMEQHGQASHAFEDAIARSADANCLHIQALANEGYGRYWLRQGRRPVALYFIAEAQRLYRYWHAPAKLLQLQG
jgi:predicted ATPase/AraC-like DNA-binding protein